MLIACPACHLQYDVGDLAPGAKVRCFCGELCTVPRPLVREAPAMHCSNCGGCIEGGARTCAYCSAEIAYADRGLGELCPECCARLVKDARYCSGCGVAIRPESVLRALQSLACPRCEGTLTLCRSAERQFTECTSCGGVWLDAATFERVSKERAQAAAAGAIPAAPAEAATRPAAEASVRYLKCPACRDLMVRKNFSGSSGVILDWCRQHGYWFDTHELEAVLRFIDAGGVERARAREHERRLLELERAQRAAPSAARPSPLPGRRASLADLLTDFVMKAF